MKNYIGLLVIVCLLFLTSCAGTPLDKIGSLMECVNDLELLKSETAFQQNAIDAVEKRITGQ